MFCQSCFIFSKISLTIFPAYALKFQVICFYLMYIFSGYHIYVSTISKIYYIKDIYIYIYNIQKKYTLNKKEKQITLNFKSYVGNL